MDAATKLRLAQQGDINAFNELFSLHEKTLKPYLYRLLTNREDVEDFYHNTFVRAFDKLDTFKGTSDQLKSWIFTIATRLAYNHLEREKKWLVDAQDVCRDSLVNDPHAQQTFAMKVSQSPHNIYDLKEHIDFCFTCLSKTLSIHHQLALLLKDVYRFKVTEVADILDKTQGQVKHLLVEARQDMTRLFEGRCALINQEGTCHQCSELQGLFNPKVDLHRSLLKLVLVREAETSSKEALFRLRETLVQSINPMDSPGMDLHDHLMQHMKQVNNLD